MNTQYQSPQAKHLSHILTKQLPSISNELIIQTPKGIISITDTQTIVEIKATIIKRASSWN